MILLWKHKWRTDRLCMAGVSQLLDVCDLFVTDGAALPLSSEHWMKSRHSGKKSDNLGMDAPCFLNNRLHPTWSRVWSPAWHDTFSIMLPNCDMAAITQHVLLASASTPLKSQVPLHRRVANLQERIKESQSRSCCKTRSHASLSMGQWLDGEKKKKEICVCFEDDSKWNLCQLRLLLKNGSTLCRCQMIWVWGCSLHILFLHFKERGWEWALNLPPSNKFVY